MPSPMAAFCATWYQPSANGGDADDHADELCHDLDDITSSMLMGNHHLGNYASGMFMAMFMAC